MNVYVLHSVDHKLAKIGVASDIPRRIRQLRAKHGPLKLVHRWTFETSAEAYRAEKALHWHYAQQHIEPRHWVARERRADSGIEWFDDSILSTVGSLDIRQVLKLYKRTQIYEVRLSKDSVAALLWRGLTVADAVEQAAGVGTPRASK